MFAKSLANNEFGRRDEHFDRSNGPIALICRAKTNDNMVALGKGDLGKSGRFKHE